MMAQPQPSTPGLVAPEPGVTLYGTLWCGATQQARRFLERHHLAYRFCDIETEPMAADLVRWWTGGDTSHPTLCINGEILIEPSLEALAGVLTRQGLI